METKQMTPAGQRWTRSALADVAALTCVAALAIFTGEIIFRPSQEHAIWIVLSGLIIGAVAVDKLHRVFRD